MPSHEGSQRTSGQILVADDDDQVRALFVRFLEKQGFSVLQAANGIEVLDCLQQDCNRVALVVLDLNMPWMGGLETLEKLKAQGNGVPVLVVTGQASAEEHQQARAAGAVDVLFKPIEPRSFLEAVLSALAP